MVTVAKTMGNIISTIFQYREVVFMALELIKPAIKAVKRQAIERFAAEHVKDIKNRSSAKTKTGVGKFLKKSEHDAKIINQACTWFNVDKNHYSNLIFNSFEE